MKFLNLKTEDYPAMLIVDSRYLAFKPNPDWVRLIGSWLQVRQMEDNTPNAIVIGISLVPTCQQHITLLVFFLFEGLSTFKYPSI